MGAAGESCPEQEHGTSLAVDAEAFLQATAVSTALVLGYTFLPSHASRACPPACLIFCVHQSVRGCWHKMPQTEGLRTMGSSTPHSSGGWKFPIRDCQGQPRTRVRVADFSLHAVEEEKELPEAPFMRVLPSWPDHLPTSPLLPRTITLYIRFQYVNFGETQTFRPWHHI